jgi:hypothetical protein
LLVSTVLVAKIILIASDVMVDSEMASVDAKSKDEVSEID